MNKTTILSLLVGVMSLQCSYPVRFRTADFGVDKQLIKGGYLCTILSLSVGVTLGLRHV